MKISLTNKTKFDSNQLKAITKIVAKNKGIVDNIAIKFYNSNCIRGRAFYGKIKCDDESKLGWHHHLRIGLTPDWKEKIDLTLRIMEHEFDHTLGLHHKDMLKWNEVINHHNYLNEVEGLICQYQ